MQFVHSVVAIPCVCLVSLSLLGTVYYKYTCTTQISYNCSIHVFVHVYGAFNWVMVSDGMDLFCYTVIPESSDHALLFVYSLNNRPHFK